MLNELKAILDENSDIILLFDNERHLSWSNQTAQRSLKLEDANNYSQLETQLRQSLPNNPGRPLAEFIECPRPNKQQESLEFSIFTIEEHTLLRALDFRTKRQVNRMRQDFVANVSHELRTPLTVILGYLESLTEMEDIPEDLISTFNNMFAQSLRMENIVKDLLLLSKLEGQKVQEGDFQTFNIASLVSGIIRDAETLSNGQHQIKTNIDEQLKIQGVADELHSAFSNLVFNAIHYTSTGGTITIRAYQDNRGIHFSVEDTGIGIVKKDIPRLTERFYRVDKGRSRSSGGTGLGLSIVKHVLLRHNASIRIDSKLGQGSLFRCDFPEPEND